MSDGDGLRLAFVNRLAGCGYRDVVRVPGAGTLRRRTGNAPGVASTAGGAPVPMPPMTRFDSSWVYAAGYDRKAEALYVTYHRDGVATVTCRYDGIPLSLWQSFKGAPSKGKWVHANIYTLPYSVVATGAGSVAVD